MDEIKIDSKIDLKTYFQISLRSAFRLRSIIIIVIFLGVLQFSLSSGGRFDWINELTAFGFLVIFYGGLLPLWLYFICRRNMKRIPYLKDTMHYTIDQEDIAYNGPGVSASSSWGNITKFIEREKYFMLRAPGRSFHFLAKEGFGSIEDMERLREFARQSGVKMGDN